MATLHRGKHAIKFGADIRRVVLDNEAAFDSKGTFTFPNFQDYLNNTAATFNQALQIASFTAKQWQTFWFAQDDFRVTPELTLEPRPALRDQRLAAGLLRRHRPGEPGRAGAGAGAEGQGQHRAAGGLQLEPALGATS